MTQCIIQYKICFCVLILLLVLVLVAIAVAYSVLFVSYFSFFLPQKCDEWMEKRAESFTYACIQHSKWMLICDASINLHQEAMPFNHQQIQCIFTFIVHRAVWIRIYMHSVLLCPLTHLQWSLRSLYVSIFCECRYCPHCSTRSIFPLNCDNRQFYIVASDRIDSKHLWLAVCDIHNTQIDKYIVIIIFAFAWIE